MQTPTTDTETTDTDAPKQDRDYYTEMWYNTDYHTGGSLRLRVFKVLEKLILSSEIADQLTSEVYWKSVRYSHRWSIRGNAASAYVLNLAREIALDYICKMPRGSMGHLPLKPAFHFGQIYSPNHR